MDKNIKIVKIDSEYCNYLRKTDYRVPYNEGNKELRPFVGILFMVNDCQYFAPLSSPKAKHIKMKNYFDFVKINNGIYGAINFNNMIPVFTNNYEIIDLNKTSNNISEVKWLNLLKNQLVWVNEHKDLICGKAEKLYELYNDNKLPKTLKLRCCDFKLLEEKCIEYNEVNV